MFINNQTDFLKNYNYIVCDEYHFFSQDSVFNHYTDEAWFEIAKVLPNTITIFMSATGFAMKKYIEERFTPENETLLHYDLGSDYSHIKDIIMFSSDEHIHSLCKAAIDSKNKSVNKVLVFIDNKE